LPGLLNTHDPAFIGGLLYGDINREWASGQATTTTAAVGSITLPSIPASRQHMILSHLLEGTGTAGARMTVNGESGAMYAYRASAFSRPDTEYTMQNFMTTAESTNEFDLPTGDMFQIGFLGDDVANQKLIYTIAVNRQGLGANIATRRIETVGKANLLNQNLTRIDVNNVNTTTQTYDANSNVSTCSIRQKPGNQPPFWEHLRTRVLESEASGFSLDNLPNRRYYWVQGRFTVTAGNTHWPFLRFNSSTANIIADTYRNNFGSEFGRGPRSFLRMSAVSQSDPVYFNMWIVNVTDRVKLFIGFGNSIKGGPSSTTVPDTYEVAGKWVNTTESIEEINFTEGDIGDFAIGTTATVWGSRT